MPEANFGSTGGMTAALEKVNGYDLAIDDFAFDRLSLVYRCE